MDLEDHTPLPNETTLKIASAGMEYSYYRDRAQALEMIKRENTPDLMIVVCNGPDFEIFNHCAQSDQNTQTVMVTDHPMYQYSEKLDGKEELIVDHVVSNRPQSSWTVHDLRITIKKLVSSDIFGISKYLTPNTQIQTAIITSSNDREPNNRAVMEYASSHNLGQHTCRSIFGITEEMLMNAIYDAPVAGGVSRYNELPRSTPVELEPREFSTLKYGFDGSLFAISVTDPFGAFRRDKLYQYVKKVLLRRDSDHLIDNKKGGAGLGIFKILYSSHALICNVEWGKKTEILALIDTHHTLRDFSKMTRSIHYFETKEKNVTPVKSTEQSSAKTI